MSRRASENLWIHWIKLSLETCSLSLIVCKICFIQKKKGKFVIATAAEPGCRRRRHLLKTSHSMIFDAQLFDCTDA